MGSLGAKSQCPVPPAGVQGQEGRHTDTLTGVLVRAKPQQNSADFLGMTDPQQESVLEMWARKNQKSARMKYMLYSEINLLFAFQLGLRVALGLPVWVNSHNRNSPTAALLGFTLLSLQKWL